MSFVKISEAIEKKKGPVKVRGWVYRIRKLKDKIFIVLRDSSEVIQCVIKDEEMVKTADKLLTESSIEIEGEIYAEPRAPTKYEIDVKKLIVVHASEDFPINKDQSVEFLADNRHLWLRSRKMTSILKIRSTVLSAMREHWAKKGFYEYHSPIFMGMQCEGGSTLFKVDYYGKPVYLSQTWQLHAEPAIFALEKIFTIQPAFRAEKSKTSRHLSELWMAEMEVAWEGFDYLQDDAEEMIKHVVKKVLDNNKNDLEILERDIKKLEPIVKKSFPRITYDNALKILAEHRMKVEWGKDLRTNEEDKLSELYDTPIIVTKYPKIVKAFYMREDPKNPKVVLGFDVIAPEHYGEIVGASERETDINKLKENLKEQGEDAKKYEFYFDTRRYGSVPHGGYGAGVERIISWICGLDNIKDAIAFPRTMTRWTP
nr:asparagine--tRNA ligase [Nanoarchaeum sp.]